MSLYISRYFIDSTPAEGYGNEHFGFRCRCASGGGWLRKMNFAVPLRSRQTALNAMNDYQGQRIMVYRPGRNLLHGYVRQAQAVGRMVEFEVGGTWGRANDGYYDTEIDPEDTISTVITNVLGAAPAIRVDSEFIATNATEIREFGTDDITNGPGIRPGKAIEELLKISNSGYDQYDFYTEVVDEGLKVNISKDRAIYTKRDPTPTTPDYIISLSDLTSRRVTADIYNLTTNVNVKYGKIEGTHDGPAGHYYLTDSSKDFDALGVRVGDTCVNITKTVSTGTNVGSHVINIINSGTTLVVLNGYGWAVGDEYLVKANDHLFSATATATASETTYWAVKGDPIEAPELTQTQAGDLANMLVTRLSVPVWNVPLTVGVDRIRTAGGAYVSAWELLRSPSVVAVEGDQNMVATPGYDINERQIYYIVALDADYSQRVITLTMGDDHRLDTILQRKGITPGQAIQPEPRGSTSPNDIQGNILAWYSGGAASFPWWADRPEDLFDKKHRPENWPWGYPSL